MVGDFMNVSSIYINEAIEYAFSTYVKTKDHKGTLEYNSFMCTIVRLLIIIFGEEVILDYQTKNPATLVFTLTKYDTSFEDANNFLTIVDKYYQAEKKQKDKAIRKKNKYFNPIQKYLIDMFVKKHAQKPFDKHIIKEFYRMLFTAKSRSFYRRSTALVMAYNPYEIDEYFRKQEWGI
jgi:hypothetical protein